MQTASSRADAPKRTGGRGRHLWQALRQTAPTRRHKPTTAIGRGGIQLYRWHVVEYPGLLEGLRQLYGGRASVHTIRDWIRGKRRAPQWALEILSSEISRHIAQLQHALEILEKEKAGD